MQVLTDQPIAKPRGYLLPPDADPASQITSWLLSSEVQVLEGPEIGGVVGWSTEGEGRGFVYGEITGYYLTFLVFLAQTEAAGTLVQPRIREAAGWIGRTWVAGANPLTRTYLDNGNATDWRNDFHFSFDLAMMLRGVGAAAPFLDPADYILLRDSLVSRLATFVDSKGLLEACRPLNGIHRPPTWSAHSGPYQLKGAAAILEHESCVPQAVRAAAGETVKHWEGYVPESIHPEDFHPLLYFVEGLILLGFQGRDDGRLRHAETVCARIFKSLSPGEFLTGTCARSDVVAQALRIGSVLRQLGYLRAQRWERFLDLLRDVLNLFYGPSGAVYFRPASESISPQANSWSSMFAVQALSAHRSLGKGLPFNPAAVRFLV